MIFNNFLIIFFYIFIIYHLFDIWSNSIIIVEIYINKYTQDFNKYNIYACSFSSKILLLAHQLNKLSGFQGFCQVPTLLVSH